MDNKIKSIKFKIAIIILIQIIVMFLLGFFFKYSIFTATLSLFIQIILLYYVFYFYKVEQEKYSKNISNSLGEGIKDTLLIGEIGIIAYDENYVITWMSDLFIERGINRIGKKILVWLPEVDSLISGKEDVSFVTLDEKVYEIRRRENSLMLIFKDVSKRQAYKNLYEDEHVVLGMINFDNYEETCQYEDEVFISNISNTLRPKLLDYAKENGILLRRLNNYRYLAILSENIFKKLVNDKFSISSTIRKAAQQLEVSITLSMAFARGSSNFLELDDMVTSLMDLTQNRGGDQVAILRKGGDVQYFGGASEALEKRSRVRTRIIANALRDLVIKSSNVIICCHKESDFDCMGAAIGFSRIVSAYGKNVSIISKTGGIELKLKQTLKRYEKELDDRFNFISENEALNQLEDNSLVIMVDHHNINQSNGKLVLEKANKIAIIDHHRRSSNLIIKPTLIFIEPGASSTCEIVVELISYLTNRIDVSEIEASIMLAGMTIDTNHFKVRTGSRTYEAASKLRSLGGDPILVDDFIKDDFNEFELKAMVMSNMERYNDKILVGAIEDKIISRSLISQIGDSVLSIKGIEAGFIISKVDTSLTAISARSNGKINVQVIMEKMNGGGHMTAAGVQIKDISVSDIKKQLYKELDIYLKESSDESNIVK